MKTDTVNTEKWRVEHTHSENGYKKGWHIITGKYDDVIDLPNGSEAQQTGELIVQAVNACKEINPDNPIAVAKALPELLEALKAFHEIFVHIEGETEKNKIKTHMIKYCDEVKEALNKSRSLIQKATATV